MIITQYRFLILFAILTGIVIVIFNSGNNGNTNTENQTSNTRTKSDAYLKGTTIIQYNKQGAPMTLDSSESSLLDSGDIVISNPYIKFSTEEDSTVTAKADKGILNSKDESLSLETNVVITQSVTDSKTITIKTNKIFLDNLNQELKTNEHVWLSDGSSTMEATGLSASLKTRELHLKSQVRGTYVIQ